MNQISTQEEIISRIFQLFVYFRQSYIPLLIYSDFILCNKFVLQLCPNFHWKKLLEIFHRYYTSFFSYTFRSHTWCYISVNYMYFIGRNNLVKCSSYLYTHYDIQNDLAHWPWLAAPGQPWGRRGRRWRRSLSQSVPGSQRSVPPRTGTE